MAGAYSMGSAGVACVGVGAMSARRSIAISGDLGSGKTTVSIELAERLGLRRVSMGDVHRELARSRGMTALQLNLSSERDEAVDAYVDRRQRELAESGEPIIIDSRLGWHFFPDAFKVHLITDSTVAAQRVLSRPGDGVESYSSLAEAEQRLKERGDSEQARFKVKYGVDKFRLRNYSLVCDTTRVTPLEAVEAIADAYERFIECPEHSQNDHDDDDTYGDGTFVEPLLILDPCRIFPMCSMSVLESVVLSETDARASDSESAVRDEQALMRIGHADRLFFAVDAESHRRLSAALRAGDRLVPARLVAEFDEEVVAGLSATSYFEQEARPEIVRAWEAEHEIDLPALPRFLEQVGKSPSSRSNQNDGERS